MILRGRLFVIVFSFFILISLAGGQDFNLLIKEYEAKYNKDPRDSDTVFNLLVLYGAIGNLEKLYEYYNILNKIDPNYLRENTRSNLKNNSEDIFNLYKIAFSYYFLGEVDKAIYYFNKLSLLRPKDDWIMGYLAYLHYLKGNYNEVEALVNKGLEINKDNEALHALRCALYLKKGNYLLALKEYFITMNIVQKKGYKNIWEILRGLR